MAAVHLGRESSSHSQRPGVDRVPVGSAPEAAGFGVRRLRQVGADPGPGKLLGRAPPTNAFLHRERRRDASPLEGCIFSALDSCLSSNYRHRRLPTDWSDDSAPDARSAVGDIGD